MKPIGTITKYYPFIDEESQSILNSLMDGSSNYYDFVQRLCKVVLENKVPLVLVFIAAVQAWWTRAEESVKLIQEKYKDEPCIRPWGYVIKSSVSDQAQYHDSIVAAIDKALDTTLADWMEVELHFIHSYLHYPTFGDVPSLLEPLERAKSLIESNPSLACFQPLILMFEGCVQGMEEYRKDSIDTHKRGLELARNNDDKLYTYLNLEPLAGVMVNFDVQESLDLFQEMYDLAQDLDIPYMIGEALYDSSIAFGFAGEYDLQISSIEECIKILGGDDSDWMELSWTYAELGDGQMALEWANQAFENVGHIEYPRLYLAKAWALALLNRVEEAEHNLDTAYSLILKTGKEYPLGIYYHIAGVIELARGDYEAALDLLEKSEEIIERIAIILYQNNVLLDLARAEILLAGQSKGSTIGITPGKWLSKLERHALERNLPGIRMYAALLKSEFYQNHDQLKNALTVLTDALHITDSPGVTTLRKRIIAKTQEIEKHLHDEEIVS